MTIVHVTEATVGAPNSGRMSGTDGDLVTMMDYALPLNGWAIEYTSGTDRVYRPGSGNRFRLCMRDSAAISGAAQFTLVRGAENASSATVWTDPFPTVAKVADNLSNWIKSTTANTTARNFDIYVGTTWVIYLVNASGSTNQWEMHIFGDCPASLAGDAYNTLITVRGTSSTGLGNGMSIGSNTTSGITFVTWCRSYDGTVKSTAGAIVNANATLGVSAGPTALLGPSGGIDRTKAIVLDTGSASTTASTTLSIPNRGAFPNLWCPLHNGQGAANTRDTFTDTSYDASSTFKVFSRPTAGFVIVEESDTWSAPSG